jgi:hypothetical protein
MKLISISKNSGSSAKRITLNAQKVSSFHLSCSFENIISNFINLKS